MEQLVEDPWRLRLALAGDSSAWAGIVDEFGPNLWLWARGQGLDRDDAEDVCQTVWYLLKDKGHTIEDPRRLPGWLATTTKRQAINTAKKKSRIALGQDENFETIVDDEASPADLAFAADDSQRLASAFQKLRSLCRELLSLLWADVAYRDIADMLDIAIGSIGATRQRCLDQLRVEAGLT